VTIRATTAESSYLAALGARVRHRRKALRLTRKAVATICGVHAQYIGQIERGCANPTVLLATRLFRVLGLELMLLEADAGDAIIGQSSPVCLGDDGEPVGLPTPVLGRQTRRTG
jgi:transcriptional regulator with XRE-family HTH domain